MWLQHLAAAYPQTPVALMCRSTSPWPGAYTGASTCFRLWSAVTCSEGFGSGVDSVLFSAKPFVTYALDLADVMPIGRESTIYRRHCVYQRKSAILYYEIERRESSNGSRDDDGGIPGASERLRYTRLEALAVVV